MIYPGAAAASLGSLLRKAQEDRQTGPHLVPQSAEESSPIRQQIQGPIASPESVGSEKVVALKGEIQPIQEGIPAGIDGTPSPMSVGPQADVIDSGVVGPQADVFNAPEMGGESETPRTFSPSPLATSLVPSSVSRASVKGVGSVLGSQAIQGPNKPSVDTSRITGGQSYISKPSSQVSRAALGTVPAGAKAFGEKISDAAKKVGTAGATVLRGIGTEILPNLVRSVGGALLTPSIKSLQEQLKLPSKRGKIQG